LERKNDMDTESLKTLGTVLLWAGLIFVMMRYGCGAHMMRRRDGHTHGADAAASAPGKDPVCGMDVTPRSAVGAAVHAGNTYYFCSARCRDAFERAPEQYVNPGATQRTEESAQHGSCCGGHGRTSEFDSRAPAGGHQQ
jgi:YHS domain-containing protein